jgi:putative protease
MLLSTRQCLFHQVIGCGKNQIDGTCIRDCEKSSSISDLKNHPLFIVKTKGDYHCIYHRRHFLNTEIVEDLPGIFSGFLVDLRQIKTETRIKMHKSGIIQSFEDFLRAEPGSKKRIEKNIHPTTNTPYVKGI